VRLRAQEDGVAMEGDGSRQRRQAGWVQMPHLRQDPLGSCL